MPNKKSSKEIFTNIIFDEFTRATDWTDKIQNEELGKVLYNDLFDLDGPKKMSASPSSKTKFVANILFSPFSEILDSLESINSIYIFIRSFPYKSKKISRVRFLKYHIGNYLNELYMLQIRLKNYLTKIQRGYRKSDTFSLINPIFKLLSEDIENTFKPCFDLRGLHIHKNRYTDKELSRLSGLEILTIRNDNNEKRTKFINSYFIAEYNKVKKKWVNSIKEDLKSIETILEDYFEILIRTITTKGKITYPSNKNWN